MHKSVSFEIGALIVTRNSSQKQCKIKKSIHGQTINQFDLAFLNHLTMKFELPEPPPSRLVQDDPKKGNRNRLQTTFDGGGGWRLAVQCIQASFAVRGKFDLGLAWQYYTINL